MGSFGAGSDSTQLKCQEGNFAVVATWIGGARECRQKDKALPRVAREGDTRRAESWDSK